MPCPQHAVITNATVLEDDGVVRLTVFNNLGQEVAVLVNEGQSAGEHRIVSDAKGLPEGVYVCRLQAGGESGVVKLIKMK